MDLLSLIRSGALSPDDARRIFDDWHESFHRDEVSEPWSEKFEFSNYESTAYSHGADLIDLVKLRYDGWPAICARCILPLDYRQYGWFFVRGKDEVPELLHIVCLPMHLRPRRRQWATIKKLAYSPDTK
jgi:hypothetical protein